MYYVSPTPLNVLAPDDAAVGAVSVQVTTAQVGSNIVSASEGAFSPALFTLSDAAGLYVAAVRPDGTLVSPGAPAKPGDTILLYGTGFGPTTPSEPIGQMVTPAPLTNQVTVQIGGLTAAVPYAGLVSAGLYQFNVVIPDVPDGDRPVSVAVGGIAASQSTPLLSIKR